MEIKIEKAKNGYVVYVEYQFSRKDELYVFTTIESMVQAMPNIVETAQLALEKHESESMEEDED